MTISEEILNRKGAIKQEFVTSEIRNLLNQGLIASVNLTEWLCIDHKFLINNVLPKEYQHTCISSINNLKQVTAMKSIPVVAGALFDSGINKSSTLFAELCNHPSDSVRCWAAYIVGIEKDTILSKLQSIKQFAADDNFGVREIAWMAVRSDIDALLEDAISILTTWTGETDINIRRFASEATRPRGVWSKHIDKLKDNPELGLSILDPLKSDSAKYVRDSVANWLNDAAKTRPDFVKDICVRWEKESQTKETAYIIKKALRSF
ncbi:MAG: DNA alkylation repair protein [Dysgonomonas sp.]